MDIPVYHNYTLAHAWGKAKMLQNQSTELGFLEKRARCLKQMCKHFYIQKMKTLNDDYLYPEEPENTLLQPPLQAPASPTINSSPGQIGLTQLAYATRSVGNRLVRKDNSTRPALSFKDSATEEATARAETVVKEATTNGMALFPAETCIQVDSEMMKEQPDGPTDYLCSALLTSGFEADLGEKSVSASFFYCPPEENSIHKSEVTVSSPHSDSSDETCVNTPDQATSPKILEASRHKRETTLHHNDEVLAERQSLDDLSIQKLAREFGPPLLLPCCNKVREEWEHTVKIIEGNQETDIANIKDDLEAVQDLRQDLELENVHLAQDHKETLRKLREKSKEVRELKRELKTKSKTLSAQEDLERSQADSNQNFESEFSSQMKELERTHTKALQEMEDQHRNEVDELGRALHVKSEELSKKATMMEDWKDRAVRLQAQHDDVCQGGMSCTQQIDSLKTQLGKRERWLRQHWPMLQHELQDANTNLAVAQQNLENAQEKARNNTTKADLRFSRLELKWKVTNEELRQAKKMLLADDAKALSACILQESADEMTNLMTQNHDRVVEILDLYRKRDIILRGHQDQVNACYAYIGELEVDKENFRTANLGLKNDCMTLNARYQALHQESTDLQITNNNLQIANNDLQISHYKLTRDNAALRADKENLEVQKAWLEDEQSKLQKETKASNSPDAHLQRAQSSIRPHEAQSQQSMSQPESKQANPGAKKPSLQDQIDAAYPAQVEAFAVVRNQRKEWINRGPTINGSNNHLRNAFPKHETPPLQSPEHSPEQHSPHDRSTPKNTPASPLSPKLTTTDTLSKQSTPSSSTTDPLNTPTLRRTEPPTPQEPKFTPPEDDTMTSSKQKNNKGVESVWNTSLNKDTKSNKDIEPQKMNNEKIEDASAGQADKDARAPAAQGGVMSRKERRAMKKRG